MLGNLARSLHIGGLGMPKKMSSVKCLDEEKGPTAAAAERAGAARGALLATAPSAHSISPPVPLSPQLAAAAGAAAATAAATGAAAGTTLGSNAGALGFREELEDEIGACRALTAANR
jgi:hypothetical protein